MNIIPTGAIFDQFNNNVTRFQQYRITKVWYDFFPVQNVNVIEGGKNDTIALMYTVPLESNQIPAATTAAYLGYKDVKVQELDHRIRGSFVPYMYTDSAETGVALRSPMISCKQPAQICYGHSLLFYKATLGATDFAIQGVLSARI